jgi:hypothetical protein
MLFAMVHQARMHSAIFEDAHDRSSCHTSAGIGVGIARARGDAAPPFDRAAENPPPARPLRVDRMTGCPIRHRDRREAILGNINRKGK